MYGVEHFEIGGKSRPLKFGTNQTAILCKLKGINLKQLNELFSVERFTNLEIDNTEIRDLIYSALVSGAKTCKEPVDFDNEEVGDWIDEMEQKVLKDIMSFYTMSLVPNEHRARVKEELQKAKA